MEIMEGTKIKTSYNLNCRNAKSNTYNCFQEIFNEDIGKVFQFPDLQKF